MKVSLVFLGIGIIGLAFFAYSALSSLTFGMGTCTPNQGLCENSTYLHDNAGVNFGAGTTIFGLALAWASLLRSRRLTGGQRSNSLRLDTAPRVART